MTITLPDEWRSRIEQRAKANGFPSVSDYVISLVEGETERNESDPNLAGRSPRNRAELEAMLDEAADGPFLVMDEDFWERLRRKCDDDADETDEEFA